MRVGYCRSANISLDQSAPAAPTDILNVLKTVRPGHDHYHERVMVKMANEVLVILGFQMHYHLFHWSSWLTDSDWLIETWEIAISHVHQFSNWRECKIVQRAKILQSANYTKCRVCNVQSYAKCKIVQSAKWCNAKMMQCKNDAMQKRCKILQCANFFIVQKFAHFCTLHISLALCIIFRLIRRIFGRIFSLVSGITATAQFQGGFWSPFTQMFYTSYIRGQFFISW